MGLYKGRVSKMFSGLFQKLYTLTYYFFNTSMHIWDLCHGTDFSFIDKSVESGTRCPYYATPWASLFPLKRYLVKHMSGGSGHSVIDIGCGKGFMLYFFTRRKFDKVAGIEYSSKLQQTAVKNLDRVIKDSKKMPRIYNEDAASFQKYDQYDTFYLYNPFDKGTLEQVIRRILEPGENPNRTLYLFYCNPLFGDVLLENGFTETASFYYKTKVYRYERI